MRIQIKSNGVFQSIMNQIEFYFVQNRKENCHHDHTSLSYNGNGNLVFSVYSCMPERRELRPLLKPADYHSTIVLNGLIGGLNWAHYF